MNSNENMMAGGVIGLILMALVLVFCLVFGVPNGHVGIVKSFRATTGKALNPGGPYLVWPWESVHNVSVQSIKNEEPADVPTKGGLTVHLKSIMIYRLDPTQAVRVINEVGEKYEEVIVDPYFKNATRDVCAEYAPEALYTEARNEVEAKVLERCNRELGPRGFIIEAIMLQEPHLPDVVKGRIEAKIGAEQDAMRMVYVFKQREQEGLANKRQMELSAEAKVIEAKGIADAQNIIKKDLDDNYLRYLWIQALKDNHAATVYVPTGHDGMPFFKPINPAGK